MDVNADWDEIRHLFRDSFRSSFHFSIATVSDKGEPHVTPIGSLILGEPGRGIYFERFPRGLPQNLENNRNVCVLAVNSGRWFWLRSLIRGKFAGRPAIRLYGVVGERRDATEREIALWQKRVKRVRWTRGHALIWDGMSKVRDIRFTDVKPVSIGRMTA